MEKIANKFMGLLMVALLMLTGISPASAASPNNTQWSETIKAKITTDVNKAWTVTFSDTIDASSVTNENVQVKNGNETLIKTNAIVEGETLRVIPEESYVLGAYTLYIGPGIVSMKGKKQKENIHFSFTVTGEVEVIESIDATGITISGKHYKVASNLSNVLSAVNADVLKNASITFETQGGPITEIQELKLKHSGNVERAKVLNGGGDAIAGTVIIDADMIEIQQLNIARDLLITDAAKNTFLADRVKVNGTVKLTEEAKAAVRTASVTGTAKIKIVFKDSTVAYMEVNRYGVYVAGAGMTTIDSLYVTADSDINMNPDVILPTVKIANGVTNIALNATIAEVIIESDRDVKVTGSGNFKSVKVDAPSSVEFDIRGTISSLDLIKPEGKVEIGASAVVVDVSLPAGKKVEEVVSNFDLVKEQIAKVDGQENPAFNPGHGDTEPDDGYFTAKAIDVPGRFGYKKLNVKNSGENQVMYLQKKYYSQESTGEIGEPVPDGAVAYQNEEEFLKYYQYDLVMYLVDKNGMIVEKLEQITYASDNMLTQSSGNQMTVKVALNPESMKTDNAPMIYVVGETVSKSFENIPLEMWKADSDGIYSTVLDLPGPIGNDYIISISIPSDWQVTQWVGDADKEAIALNHVYFLLEEDPFNHYDNEYTAYRQIICYGELGNICYGEGAYIYENNSLSFSEYKKTLIAKKQSVRTMAQALEVMKETDVRLKGKVDLYKAAVKAIDSLFKEDRWNLEFEDQYRNDLTQKDIDSARQAVQRVDDAFKEKEWMLSDLKWAEAFVKGEL